MGVKLKSFADLPRGAMPADTMIPRPPAVVERGTTELNVTVTWSATLEGGATYIREISPYVNFDVQVGPLTTEQARDYVDKRRVQIDRILRRALRYVPPGWERP